MRAEHFQAKGTTENAKASQHGWRRMSKIDSCSTERNHGARSCMASDHSKALLA
jgi:hypothetical protein